MNKITLGISSCLLGNPVRHDGSHKKNQYVMESLSSWFEFRAVCPEAAIGLGVPRPAMRLVKTAEGIRMVVSKSPENDLTDRLIAWSENAVDNMHDLSGYILKSQSPSCGMERVRIFDHNGVPKKEAAGLFASTLMQAMPWLPVEEEGRLNDPALRENFIQRVYIYHRWQQMIARGISVASLMEFHQRHKLQLLAHNEAMYRQLGRHIAGVNRTNLEAVAQHYLQNMMHCMSQRATRKRHTNVLMHVMGYLKHKLTGQDKQELLDALEQYRTGLLPIVVPLTLLKHHLRVYPDPYIGNQHYLSPYPEALMLRNMI
jgi:uncharacterized protein YbgA (DUF1722 family)/uncharacterized protein YbbK (DUF523 family)